MWIVDNVLEDNATAQVMVIAYPLPFEDESYNPYPREVVVTSNMIGEGGTNPDIEGAEPLLAAFGGSLPPILWDGLEEPDDDAMPALLTQPGEAGWSLNLAALGQRVEEARPGPLDVPAYGQPVSIEGWGAPEALEARIK